MTQVFASWHPVEGIDQPCADISFSYSAPSKLRVTMHFSRTAGALRDDLEIDFEGAVGLLWMEESAHSVAERMQSPLPKCHDLKWANWTFPLLVVSNSEWLSKIEALPLSQQRVHFLLVSMNDIVEVLALRPPSAKWVVPHEA